jgi:hypothetical protein
MHGSFFAQTTEDRNTSSPVVRRSFKRAASGRFDKMRTFFALRGAKEPRVTQAILSGHRQRAGESIKALQRPRRDYSEIELSASGKMIKLEVALEV